MELVPSKVIPKKLSYILCYKNMVDGSDYFQSQLYYQYANNLDPRVLGHLAAKNQNSAYNIMRFVATIESTGYNVEERTHLLEKCVDNFIQVNNKNDPITRDFNSLAVMEEVSCLVHNTPDPRVASRGMTVLVHKLNECPELRGVNLLMYDKIMPMFQYEQNRMLAREVNKSIAELNYPRMY